MGRGTGKYVARSTLGQTRRMLVDAVARGLDVAGAALAFNVTSATALRWVKRAEAGVSLEPLPVGGSAPKLTVEQISLLDTWVRQDPRSLGFGPALWTRTMLVDLVAEKFDVSYTPEGMGRLLHRMGYSPQRPLRRAYEANPGKVAAWMQDGFPAIARAARGESALGQGVESEDDGDGGGQEPGPGGEGAGGGGGGGAGGVGERGEGGTVMFADEASVRTDYHAGTTWGRVGVTPVVAKTGKRLSVNMVSAVSPAGRLVFSFVEGAGTSATFIVFLTQLLTEVVGRIFVVVDSHSAHMAKATKKFVADHCDRLSLHFLPGYSPQLNPDESVWGNVKAAGVGRAGVHNVADMKDVISSRVKRLQENSSIVRGFFKHPDLAYIAAA